MSGRRLPVTSPATMPATRNAATTASKVQSDPHVERLCISSIEEYRQNGTSRKDDILRGWTKYLSRGIRRSTELGCYELYMRQFA